MTTTVQTSKGGTDSLYKQRWERSFAVSEADARRIEQIVGEHVAFDTEFPNPQVLDTVYIRRAGKEGSKEDFRLRSYPGSPEAPVFLEFKDTVTPENNPTGADNPLKMKTKTTVDPETATRLLWGEAAADVIGTEGRSGEDLEVARRAIHDIDDLGLRPVVHGTYTRSTYNDAEAGIRITFDRNPTFQGIGELARGGSFERDHAIMDVKLGVPEPSWVTAMLDAEIGAGRLVPLEAGKGGTAVKEIAKHAAEILKHAG